jgi:hypothetical protein
LWIFAALNVSVEVNLLDVGIPVDENRHSVGSE